MCLGEKFFEWFLLNDGVHQMIWLCSTVKFRIIYMFTFMIIQVAE